MLETSKITLPKSQRNRQLFWKPTFLENSFFESRPHMAAQADPQRATWSYIDPLSIRFSSKSNILRTKNRLLLGVFYLNPSLSWKHTFSFGAVWGVFFQWSIRGRSGGDPGGIRGPGAGGGRPGGPTGKGLAGGPTGKGLAGGRAYRERI